MGEIHGTATSVGESREEPQSLAREVLVTQWRPWEPQRLLNIFGQVWHWLRLTTALEWELQRQEETIDLIPTYIGYIWPDTDVCWRSLVGARVGSGYLGQD